MGKLALKIYKALYGLDIEAQSTELTRLRLENKRLSELLRSTSREYNALNDKYKKKKESLSNEYGVVSNELNELKGKYEALVMEKENLENTLKENSEKFKEETDRVSLESEKMSGEIESLQKVIEGLNAEKDTLEKEKETLCKEKETLGTEKENLAKELEAINKEKEAVSNELKSIKECHLSEKESLNKELESLHELHKAEKENHNSEYELVADELKALKEQYETLVKEKEELEKSAKENSEKHKEETSKISFESEKMSGEIENLQKVIKGLNAEKDALIKEKENLRNENETLLQEKNVLNSEKESLDKKNEELGKENETLNKEKEVLGKEIKSANEAHIADKNKLNKEIDSLGKEIASLKELYQKEKEENTTLSEKVKTLESEIANFSLTAQMKEEVYSVIEKEDEELPAVETSIDEKSEKITDDEEEMKEMMQKEIISLTQKYDYIRVTTTIGNQYIYQSRHFQLRTGLFDWGIEGKEIITDEILYLENSAVTKMEGLDSPFDGEEIICNMEDEDSASAVADSLLMAICTYQPIQVNYHDKNGRTTLKNLYHVTFKPLANKFSLPYKNLFRDMLDEKIDAEQLSALCPHNPEPRNFAIPQIQTLRRFNAFFTTKEGIETMKEGIKLAKDAEQTELAEVLMSKIQN